MMRNLDEIRAFAAELGARHALEARVKFQDDQVLAACDVDGGSDLRYAVIAAYEDGFDIARAEADPRQAVWPQPISRDHKLWLRSNLVYHNDLAKMTGVPPARISRETAAADWPGPVIARAGDSWYWWPHVEAVLAARGLHLQPGSATPASGPAPSWWGDLPADPDFSPFLRGQLMDLGQFAAEYMLDQLAIQRARRYPDYPEPVIGREDNSWYWWPDLDRFAMRHCL
jgi:hypothetical protein